MKLFKIIMNCVIATLLVVSITLNIFVLAGFRIVDTDTYNPNTNVSQNANNEPQNESEESHKKHDNKHHKDKTNELENTSVKESEEETIRELVYQDDNITVYFCGLKEDTAELTYLFEVENNSNTALNITFDNLLVDGARVYNSGLTCEKLLPGNVSVEDFVVKDFDGSQDSDVEREFAFNIKLMNAKSYLDLYETEQVTVEV
jgi:hypothetical protein